MKLKTTSNFLLEKMRLRWEEFAEHEHRPDVGGEHKYGDLLQLILFLLFIGVGVIDHFFIKSQAVLSPHISWWARVSISLLLLVIGLRLAKEGLRVVFGDVREKAVVIYQGVFTHLRHPIYLGAILMYLAAVVLTLSLAAGAVWVLVLVSYAFLAQHEEKLLIKKFGEEYRQYMQLVPMWIPRPKT